MSKHNILFYSSHPSDELSSEILQLLNSDQLLKEQFVTICVNSPGIKLPKMIVERNEVPVIITRGFNQPIAGEAALNLIKEHQNSDKALGLDFGDPGKAGQVSEDHGILASESGRTSYHQAFNDDWNAGAENDVRTLNSQFSDIEDTNQIDTIEEQDRHNTKNLGGMMKRRMNNLDRTRGKDFNQMRQLNDPRQHGQTSMSLNQLNPNASNVPMYNPFPNGAPQVPELPTALRGVETKPSKQMQPQPNFNNFSRLMGGGEGNRGMTNNSRQMQPQMRTRDGSDFPPTPAQNPLFPNTPHKQNSNRLGMPGPPRTGGRVNPGADLPELPPGFGTGNNGFTTLDSAFTGQSLMGTPMKGSARQPNLNDRREKSLGPGLPFGRGHGGTFNQMVNTNNY
tara:strand:- start:9460 stop:10644 length:1185 start_codon:yes stop_codon:yes gene_type:complete